MATMSGRMLKQVNMCAVSVVLCGAAKALCGYGGLCLLAVQGSGGPGLAVRALARFMDRSLDPTSSQPQTLNPSPLRVQRACRGDRLSGLSRCGE